MTMFFRRIDPCFRRIDHVLRRITVFLGPGNTLVHPWHPPWFNPPTLALLPLRNTSTIDDFKKLEVNIA